MRCQRCQLATGRHEAIAVPAHGARIWACEICRTTLLILDGITLHLAQDAISRLALFGLGLTGDPLLQPEESID